MQNQTQSKLSKDNIKMMQWRMLTCPINKTLVLLIRIFPFNCFKSIINRQNYPYWTTAKSKLKTPTKLHTYTSNNSCKTSLINPEIHNNYNQKSKQTNQTNQAVRTIMFEPGGLSNNRKPIWKKYHILRIK